MAKRQNISTYKEKKKPEGDINQKDLNIEKN